MPSRFRECQFTNQYLRSLPRLLVPTPSPCPTPMTSSSCTLVRLQRAAGTEPMPMPPRLGAQKLATSTTLLLSTLSRLETTFPSASSSVSRADPSNSPSQSLLLMAKSFLTATLLSLTSLFSTRAMRLLLLVSLPLVRNKGLSTSDKPKSVFQKMLQQGVQTS
jgi:hypothetical protein